MLNPTQADPIVFDKYKGMNDKQAPCKLERGNVSFEINLDASTYAASRRAGRDFFFYTDDGAVTGLWQITWQDGITTDIASIGSEIYDLTFTFTFMLASGSRLVLQSPDLNYWDITPNANGLINPTVIAAPGAVPQAANFTVLNGESFGFETSGQVTRLAADQEHYGWYLIGYGVSNATTTYTSDLVFTVASGFSFRIQDNNTNMWRFSITNDGNLTVITV